MKLQVFLPMLLILTSPGPSQAAMLDAATVNRFAKLALDCVQLSTALHAFDDPDANYQGGYWLGSFAVYLATQRGMAWPERPR